MQLLILLVLAFVLSYWVSHKYQTNIHNSFLKSKNWVRGIFRGSQPDKDSKAEDRPAE